MQYSNHTDNLNRAIAFEVNQKDVTRFGGLAPLMNRARRSGVPAALARVIDKYTPRDQFNFVYDTDLNFQPSLLSRSRRPEFWVDFLVVSIQGRS